MSDTSIVAAILAAGAIVLILAIVYFVLCIIGYWKLFTKAGEAGWKSIIPFYNGYICYKIAWKTTFFWVMLAICILSGLLYGQDGFLGVLYTLLNIAIFVLHVLFCNKLAKAFGKGIGYTIGLIFLAAIFVILLGFGSAEYKGAQK